MRETEHEDEATEPQVTDVPEPDQDPGEEEAEAEANESQEPAEEPEETPEAHGPTQEEWEARFTYADRTFSTYAKKVEAKWAEDAVHLVRFNLDPAAPPGYLDMRNKGRVEDDTKAAALGFLGFDTESGMKEDPYSHVCEVCEGWGLVVTGSKVPNQDTRRCDDCRGVGYVLDAAPTTSTNGQNATLEVPEHGTRVPTAVGVESPEVESLRLRGYTIIPPMQTSP
jgi:hypothetical protein